MNLRVIVLSVVMALTFNGGLFGQTNQPLSLSAIQHYWNYSTQQFDLIFNVGNNSNKTEAVSVVLIVTTTTDKNWQSTELAPVAADSTGQYNMSFSPGDLQANGFVKIMVGLYGNGYKGYIDKSIAYLKIKEYEAADDNKYKINYVEEWPKDIFGSRIPENELFNVGTLHELAASSSYKKQRQVKNQKISERRKEWRLKTLLPLKKEAEIISELEFESTLAAEVKELRTVSYFPEHLAEGIAFNAKVKVQFDKLINPKKISKNNFYLSTNIDDKKVKMDGAITVSGSDVEFSPAKPLTPNTKYEVTLLKSVVSMEGDVLSSSYSWNFTTAESESAQTQLKLPKQYLKLISVYPGVKAKNILVDDQIKIFFKTQLDPKSINQQTLVLKTKGRPVEGETKIIDKTLVFTPTENLKFNRDYEITLTNPIKNMLGHQLKSGARWSFKSRQEIIYPASEDPNILIFSPTHDPISYILEKKGVLNIGITAFDKILHIDVNGEKIDFGQSSKVNFDIPYDIKTLVTKFEINTFTEVGKNKKTYVINYGYKPSTKKSFQFIGIFEISNTDNVTSTNDSALAESAMKNTLTTLMQYDIDFGKTSSLRSKVTLLREKYANSDYKDYEIVYNQIAFEWIEKKTFIGDITAGVGWNFVSTETSGATGENELVNETFFLGKLVNKFDKKTTLTSELEYKNKNSISEADDPDEETDAVSITLKEKYKFPISDTENVLKVSYNKNNAIGKYEDSVTIKYSYRVSIPWGDNLTPSLFYENKQVTMDTANPATEDKRQQDIKTTTKLGLKYKFIKRHFLTASYSMINQSSNITSSVYSENIMALSYMYIY